MKISNNQLQSLPESLSQLTNLRMLHIYDNQLQSLPEFFANSTSLTSLTDLTLDNNRLQTLPELGNLQRLEYLRLTDNELQHLPNLGDSKTLKKLMVGRNDLQSIPTSLCQLQTLELLRINNNRLQDLPSLENLTKLRILDVKGNRLQSHPQLPGSLRHLDVRQNQLSKLKLRGLQDLEELLADGNRLAELADLDLPKLKRLYLQDNELSEFMPVALPNLELLLLFNNRLQHGLQPFCHLQKLTTLYLHKNRLRDSPPLCLSFLKSLEVLTLHQNQFSGAISEGFSKLEQLKVLTLHQNMFSGRLPEDFAKFRSLVFLSAHNNRFTGRIPELRLVESCANDHSFGIMAKNKQKRHEKEITCAEAFDLDDWLLTSNQKVMVKEACPLLYGWCNNASARGPTLLLHSNRLSCDVPFQVTASPASSVRSLVIIGNMLGEPTKELPRWIAEVERQPFLYISSSTMHDLSLKFAFLAALCAIAWRLLLGTWQHLWIGEAPDEQTEINHRYLIRSTGFFLPLAVILCMIYTFGSSYYTCGDDFHKTTLAYFDWPSCEALLCCTWFLWICACVGVLGRVPKPAKRQIPQARAHHLWWIAWFGIVCFLSAPSILYAVASTLPKQNSMMTSPLWLIKNETALVMILVDMLVTPRLAAEVSQRSKIRRSMLLMAARSATMWLNATLCTVFLSEHCNRGWTRTWSVCYVSEDYKMFNVSLGGHDLLEPKNDLCHQNHEWWATDACMRSLIDTLAPLFLSKMIQRALLQPVITLVLWKLSVEEDGYLYFSPLRYLGVEWRILTSRSLDGAAQATFLVTLAEVLFVWAPFIPLLLPVAALTAATNLRVFRVGGSFGARPPVTEVAGMSRKYMIASVLVCILFQNWFAWTSKMSGRWLLALTPFAFLGLARRPPSRDVEETELVAM